MKNILIILCVFSLLSCKNETKSNEKTSESQEESIETIKEQSVAEIKAKLVDEGYEVFDYVDEKTKDTTLMQQYFIAFLKRGPIRNQNEEESARLQKEHLAHLGKMYELGYADISGPFGDDGDIRGITIYNVPTLEMADSLANADPMVKAGRLVIELHPWWAAKGFPLR
ncbi:MULTISPECIES: YciI family protein [Winogradskyella]|uniref:YciI family protein n=1 Tax=Winogradskyella TaxID=286104 RepID=UPI00399B67D9